MKKMVIAIALVSALLCGCSNCCKEPKERIDDRFVTVQRQTESRFRIIVDTETNVMYLMDGLSHQGGITVLLNADGTPMLWDEKEG